MDDSHDESRRRVDAAIRTEQLLKDHIDRYERDWAHRQARLKWDDDWRDELMTTLDKRFTTMDIRIKPFEDLRTKLENPMKVAGTLIIIMITPLLGMLGWDIGKAILEWMNRAVSRGRP